ncbi:ArnT family glycosyltransferase [Qipengyuania mesophila]|uniref:ArnT family glycosyltransferase n=1 Tax=Qipengyuania mesophila TaxID=2867246 RepID=UPI0035198E1D
MTGPAISSGGAWRRDLAALAVILLAVLVVRAPWIGDANADIDEQLYSLIGNAMLHGQLPFVDLWDRKPFGLFALFALAHAVGGPGPAAYQLLAGLFTLAGAAMTYALARWLVDRITATGAGLLYVMLMSTYGSHSGQTEAFHVPLMLAMALLVRDPAHPHAIRRALTAMLLGGLALQVKYTVLPQCLFFGLWALWGQRQQGADTSRLVHLAFAFAVLGLLPTAAVGACYAAIGEWDAFVFANFTSFFDRLPARVGRFSPDQRVFLLPLAVLLLLGAYAAARMSPPRDRRTYGFIMLWLLASAATVYFPATVYRYYYAALVPGLVLFALPLIDRRGPARFVPLILVLAGAATILFLPRQYAQSQVQRATIARLASAIAPHVDARHCLWIFDGPTALYRMTGSCLPTRFIYPDHLNNALERDSLGVKQEAEIARILAARPPVIVTADTALTPQNPRAQRLVTQEIAAHYRPLAQARLHERNIRAWQRVE